MKLRNQLFTCFLLFALIPMCVLGIATYYISYHAILDNTVSLTQEVIRRTTDEIDSTIILTETIAENIQYEPSLQAAIRTPINPDDYDERISTLQINTLLSLIQSYTKPSIFGIYCVGENGRQFKSNTLSMVYADPQGFDWYQDIFTGESPVWFPPHRNSLIATTAGTEFISYGAPFVDKLTGQRNGVILLELRASIFQDSIKNIGILELSEYFIVDEYGSIISASSPRAGQTSESLDSSSALKYEQELSNGWRIVCVISEANIARQALMSLTLIMGVVLAGTVICSMLMSLHMSKQLSRPIGKLMNLMQEVEDGNFAVSMEHMENNYEMKNLSRSFNAMVKQCNKLMQQIKNDQLSLRKSHFAALQAQINPHFLYNSLDTIAWNIRMDKKKEAVAAVLALTRFFRRSLSKGEDIVRVRDEVEHISLYLQLQQLRYSDTMQYHIDLDPALADYITPKLVLQPIVENALYHGIKNKGALGTIDIRIFSETHYIIMSVTDDGMGMTPVQVQKLNYALQHRENIHSESAEGGYGVSNVNERIQIYFGSEYGLFYTSEYGSYTTAHLVLPQIKDEQQLSELYRRKDPRNEKSIDR